MPELPEIMTIEKVSAYLRVPLSSLNKLVQQGKIPASKVGRHWRVPGGNSLTGGWMPRYR